MENFDLKVEILQADVGEAHWLPPPYLHPPIKPLHFSRLCPENLYNVSRSRSARRADPTDDSGRGLQGEDLLAVIDEIPASEWARRDRKVHVEASAGIDKK